MAIFSWIEGWYNPRRRHKGLGQKSPVNFEKELQLSTNMTHADIAEALSNDQIEI